ncbi:MAG: hypothetical protein JJU41_11200 [Bacteroidetes bacterium]|nr:hypothetical protein [Bacteroidota bacterium]
MSAHNPGREVHPTATTHSCEAETGCDLPETPNLDSNLRHKLKSEVL